MAAGRIVIPNYMPALDGNGDPYPGAKMYFYDNLTTTLKNVYTDSTLSTAHTNPVVADASGVFASIWADTTETFSVTVTTSAGVTLATYDNVSASTDIYGITPTNDYFIKGNGTTWEGYNLFGTTNTFTVSQKFQGDVNLDRTAANNYITLSTAADAAGRQLLIAKEGGGELTLPLKLVGDMEIAPTNTSLGKTLLLTKTLSDTGLSSSTEDGEVLRVTSQFDAQQTNGYNYTGSAITARVNAGVSQDVQSTFHVFTGNLQLYDASNPASGKVEMTPNFMVLNARSDSTNHGTNLWMTDWNLYGPSSGQEGFMGAAYMVAKYHNGTTDDADHRGAFAYYTASKPQGGGGKDEGVSGLTSYPLKSAHRIVGWSGAQDKTSGTDSGASNAFDRVFWIGGATFTGPWLGTTARSKFGSILVGEDFVDYGLHLLNKHPDNTTGGAINIESTAGGVGIWSPPDNAIPLKVASNNHIAMRLLDQDAGADGGPTLQLFRDSASPAASDNLGQIDWYGKDDGANDTVYARIFATMLDPNASSEDASVTFQAVRNASLTTFLQYSSTSHSISSAVSSLSLTADTASIEIGGVGSSNTPFIDMHSSSSSTDYDVRMQASGGSSSSGEGTLTITASAISLAGTVHYGNLASAPSSPGAGSTYYDTTTNKHRGYNGSSWNDFY